MELSGDMAVWLGRGAVSATGGNVAAGVGATCPNVDVNNVGGSLGPFCLFSSSSLLFRAAAMTESGHLSSPAAPNCYFVPIWSTSHNPTDRQLTISVAHDAKSLMMRRICFPSAMVQLPLCVSQFVDCLSLAESLSALSIFGPFSLPSLSVSSIPKAFFAFPFFLSYLLGHQNSFLRNADIPFAF